MASLTKDRIETLFNRFSSKRIIVIGDLMLDHYVWGNVSRISPEAPVPVVDVASESFMFGGSANVVHNVITLGSEVIPVGVIGSDEYGDMLKGLFKERNVSTDGLLIDRSRPTIVKTRIIAHNQHVVRVDRELRGYVDTGLQDRIIEFILDRIDEIDGVIFQDYDKGVCTPKIITSVIDTAVSKNKMVFVDPKFDNFFHYKGATLFKPNRLEVSNRLNIRLDSEEEIEKAGKELLRRLESQAVLITLGEKGMALFEDGKKWLHIKTRARRVHDVSGAGDTVIAAAAVAMISGATAPEAANIANFAAGIVCGELGVVPVEKERLFNLLMEQTRGS